jgi:hypothetical protein
MDIEEVGGGKWRLKYVSSDTTITVVLIGAQKVF